MKRGYTECQEGGCNEEPLSKKEKKNDEKPTLCLDAWTVVVSFCDDEAWWRLTQTCREIHSLREIECLTIDRKITVPAKVRRIRNLRQYLRVMYGTLFNLRLGSLECLLKAKLDEELAQHLDKTRILEIIGCNDIEESAFWHLRNVRELKLLHCGTLSPRSFAPLKQLKKLVLQTSVCFTERTFQDLANLEVFQVQDMSGGINLNNMNGIEHMRNLRELKVPRYPSMKEDILRHIGNKLEILDISYCKNITDSAIQHLKRIRNLNVAHCSRLTDQALQYLPGIHTLNISGCKAITGSGFQYLKGIHTLIMKDCTSVTDESIQYLSGIHTLDMSRCHQIKGHYFQCLEGIRILNISGCPEIDAQVLRKLSIVAG
jgi:hypothetical protein